MAQNLLSIATDGYLCKDGSRNLIAIATRGYIGCTGDISPIPEPPKKIEVTQSGWSGPSIEEGKRVKLSLKDIPLREYNEDIALKMIQIFLKCQDEDIL